MILLTSKRISIVVACLLFSYTIISPLDNDFHQSAHALTEKQDQGLPPVTHSGSVFSSLKDKGTRDESASSSASSFSVSSSVSASGSASQATGDFNGDGKKDLAIGVPFESVDSSTTGQSVGGAGAVNVIYGSSKGLSATATKTNQIWTQNSGSIDDSSEQADNFGKSVASGDFNGDGFDDLAVGIPSEDVGSVIDAGGVEVIYGSSTGLSATTVPDQFWTQASANVEDISEQGDNFGSSLAAGDFNGDGKDDLAIGVPHEGIVSSTDQAGGVNVIYGSSTGLSTTTVPDQFWSQDSANVEDVSEQGDNFGSSLAAGDFNGDGDDDLGIGIPSEDVGSVFDAGAVSVIHGSSTGLSATTVPDQFWSQDSANVEDVSEQGDNFGSSLAAGDFNGDGDDDLGIGVWHEGVVSSNDQAGAVNVIYGSSTGLSATTVPDQFWTQDSASVDDSAETDDLLGFSLVAGDFNGDGDDDLGIGVLGEDVVFQDDSAGAVSIIYGSSTGLSATSVLPDKFLTQEYPNVAGSSDSGDEFGFSVAAGDFKGDSKYDLAIGVPGEDVGNPRVDRAGAVNVIYGSSVGISPTQAPVFDQFFSEDSPDIGLSPDQGDSYGYSLG